MEHNLELSNYTKYGRKYLISKICLQTLPCQHTVINTETNEMMRLLGTKIFELLDQESIVDEHFEKYRTPSKTNYYESNS